MAGEAERMLFKALWRVLALGAAEREGVFDGELLTWYAAYWAAMDEDERRDWVMPDGVREWFKEWKTDVS